MARGKSVALVGMGATRAEALKSRAAEFWTVNHSYAFITLPRIDRLFDMHPWHLWMPAMASMPRYAGDAEHYRNLQRVNACPVYMLRQYPDVANSVEYPIEGVTRYIFGGRLQHGKYKFVDFYHSAFDYMMALAIYERYEVIEAYGFEMSTKAEYHYQRESAHGFIMAAVARGIVYRFSENSQQINLYRYGYELDGTMVSRQTLEVILRERLEELAAETDAIRKLKLEGSVSELRYIIEQLDLPEK